MYLLFIDAQWAKNPKNVALKEALLFDPNDKINVLI